MSIYDHHLIKATIHLIKIRFGLNEVAHYKIIDGEDKYFAESRPELNNLNELFETVYNREIGANKSIKGFIEREIVGSIEKKNILKSHPYFYDFLVEWIYFLETKKITPQQIPISENPYPRIFKNLNCFLFFERLENDVREKYILADYSFIYRRLQKDGYVFKSVSESEFRAFLGTKSIEIDKLKLLAYCNTDIKESNYNTKKQLFKDL